MKENEKEMKRERMKNKNG